MPKLRSKIKCFFNTPCAIFTTVLLTSSATDLSSKPLVCHVQLLLVVVVVAVIVDVLIQPTIQSVFCALNKF